MLQIPVSAGGFDSKLVFWCLLAVHIYTISSGAEFQKARLLHICEKDGAPLHFLKLLQAYKLLLAGEGGGEPRCT